MQWTGILIGAFSFAVIGLFHPIVIRCEYHFSCRVWPIFLVTGLLCLLLSLRCETVLFASLCSVLGFTCLWSIGELKQQEKRVERGWFPRNPKRVAPARPSMAERRRHHYGE